LLEVSNKARQTGQMIALRLALRTPKVQLDKNTRGNPRFAQIELVSPRNKSWYFQKGRTSYRKMQML